jgi:hypothetical protein
MNRDASFLFCAALCLVLAIASMILTGIFLFTGSTSKGLIMGLVTVIALFGAKYITNEMDGERRQS